MRVRKNPYSDADGNGPSSSEPEDDDDDEAVFVTAEYFLSTACHRGCCSCQSGIDAVAVAVSLSSGLLLSSNTEDDDNSGGSLVVDFWRCLVRRRAAREFPRRCNVETVVVVLLADVKDARGSSFAKLRHNGGGSTCDDDDDFDETVPIG